MRTYIRKLRNKSETSRKQILLVWMSVSFVVVVSVWIYGLTAHVSSVSDEQYSNAVKPFKLFADSISGAYQNITASVGNIKTPKTEDAGPKQIDLIPVEHNIN